MTFPSRRNFLKTGLAAGVLAGAGKLPLRAAGGSAGDWVTLGKSGVQVTRLAFGTGTFNGRVQRDLGQENFTRLVRHAYDRGIRFFETAETYAEMHQMLAAALKGLSRDSYRLMSKVTTAPGVDPLKKIDQLRRLANTDYFDVLLMHYQHVATWPADTAPWQDGILEAKSRKMLVGHGASVHGLPALRRFPGNQWLEIAMIRMNHKGSQMDTEDFRGGPGNVQEVVEHMHEVKRQRMGVISMKLVGEGTFTSRQDRQTAMKFAFQQAGVDCVTVGYKTTAEIDEAIENVNLALG